MGNGAGDGLIHKRPAARVLGYVGGGVITCSRNLEYSRSISTDMGFISSRRSNRTQVSLMAMYSSFVLLVRAAMLGFEDASSCQCASCTGRRERGKGEWAYGSGGQGWQGGVA